MKLTMSYGKRWLGLILIVAGLAVLMSSPALADGHSGHSHHATPPATPTAAVAAETRAVAPAAVMTDSTVIRTRCPVMGEPIDTNVFVDYQDQRIYFCCPMCPEQFAADPDRYLPVSGVKPDGDCDSAPAGCDSMTPCPALPDAVVTDTPAAQTRCPVRGGPIDRNVSLDYQGRRIYFCCRMCPDKFKANPARYLAILDAPPSETTARMGGCGPESPAPPRGHCGHSRGNAAPPTMAATYTCPMHPEIVRDAPGSCPKCGMYLVPRKE